MNYDTIDIIAQCLECKKIRLNKESDVWYNLAEYSNLVKEYYKDYKISHTYCPECYEKVKELLKGGE